MTLDHAITYWKSLKERASETAMEIVKKYADLERKIRIGCGQEIKAVWRFAICDEWEYSIVVDENNLHYYAKRASGSSTIYEFHFPYSPRYHWGISLERLERMIGHLQIALDEADASMEEMFVGKLMGERSEKPDVLTD